MKRRLTEKEGDRVKEKKERQGYSNNDRLRDRDYSRQKYREKDRKKRDRHGHIERKR